MLELLDLRERGERLEAGRPEIDPTVFETVQRILQRVFVEGDDVLIELAQRFDDADLSEDGLMVRREEFAVAEHETPGDLKWAIDSLIERMRELHARQLPTEWWEDRDGVRYGEIVRPIRAVGCYVPGGRAIYPSSVCMTVVPAVVAGVPEIVLCTPPRADGTIHPAVLYAAKRAGTTYVAKTGGAQAIAAMAYGTESIPRVDRIVGPGNAYVTEAKRQLCGTVGIDSLAGPSELAIVTDGEVDPELVALDLIAQAEHDPQARTYLITTDEPVIAKVGSALEQAVAEAGRREIVDVALAGSRGVLVRDLDHAATIVDELAPEHLLVLVADPEGFLEKVSVAGAVFLGEWSAVPFGDYGVASNHVLPTSGTARFSSGLRASDYVTIRSVVRMTGAGGGGGGGGRGRAGRRRGRPRERGRTRRSREGGGGQEGSGVSAPAAPRPGLREVGPYDSPQLEVAARLNTNECPLPLPVGFSDDLAAAVRELELHRYPDGQMRALREALAERTGHGVDGVWAANGSNEVLAQLLTAYGGPGRRAVLFEPTYLLHRRLCLLTHTETTERTLDPPFVIDDDAIAWAAASAAHVAFVCSPNNPTGNAQPLDAIRSLASRSDRLVIVDEAYVEFGGQTALPLVAEHPNVAVVRTFSKAFALAGARIGYVLASPAVVEDLQRVRLPYHMSALTQAAGVTALRYADEASAGLDAIRIERDRIVRGLSEIDGATVFPSVANFVLFQPPGDAKEVWHALVDRGVLVRDLTEVVPNGLRVTAGTPQEVDLFLKALDEVLTQR